MIAAFLSGALFAIGLAISGMVRPSKVLAFLDVGGHWDPSLALVMVGGIVVYAAAVQVSKRRATPFWAATFPVFTRNAIDLPLVGGAALFGVGWGLSGYCPGPALLSVAVAMKPAIWFVPSMLTGMAIFHVAERWRARPVEDETGGGQALTSLSR